MKWSDGTPVTMEDVLFTWNDCLGDSGLTPAYPADMCSGGKLENGPLGFEQIDERTFKLISSEPYGGFLLNLTFTGWPGYSDLIKPAYYLKPFHLAYLAVSGVSRNMPIDARAQDDELCY